MRKIFFFLLFAISPLLANAAVDYTVSIQGIENETLLTLIEKASDLYRLQASPPSTRSALKRRAENDLANIVNALRSQALYNARVQFEYNFISKPAHLTIHIEPGSPYPLTDVQITSIDQSHLSILNTICLEDLGVILPQTATPKFIRQIESSLIRFLDESGYPYAKIVKNEVIADQKTRTVKSLIRIDIGMQMTFGPITIEGSCKVKRCYIEKKIRWCPGELYCPSKITCTQKALESSLLFTGVEIVLPEVPPENGILPVTIQLQEARYRSIGLGINYTTQRGPGISANWENRNLLGSGEVLDIRAGIWDEEYFGSISLVQPEFPNLCETLIWTGEIRREETVGYTADYALLSLLAQRSYNPYMHISYGLTYKHLKDSNIHEESSNGDQILIKKEEFELLKFPYIFHWQYVNDTLNPTCGCNVRFEAVPSYQFLGHEFTYATNILTTSFYVPLSSFNERILAFRMVLGSIPGPSRHTIPRSELFDAGTDTLLRGYRYKTVSPLDNQGEPTGGRSMLIYTSEFRTRFSQDFGLVFFHDMGNVYAEPYPQPYKKFLHSVGIGLRYFTVVAPIRIDFAIPLNFRKEIDRSHYQVYFSLGQSF